MECYEKPLVGTLNRETVTVRGWYASTGTDTTSLPLALSLSTNRDPGVSGHMVSLDRMKPSIDI